ncbi:MAG UNVERIFIED_CONTAM: hypothetical protein LVT10_10535 [Anaerolineae bacterium]
MGEKEAFSDGVSGTEKPVVKKLYRKRLKLMSLNTGKKPQKENMIIYLPQTEEQYYYRFFLKQNLAKLLQRLVFHILDATLVPELPDPIARTLSVYS